MCEVRDTGRIGEKENKKINTRLKRYTYKEEGDTDREYRDVGRR